MARDHYAVLGVTPTSEDVVIRAAYRALMRRYHPDADPSSEASQRAQAINAAYVVLSDPEKRARYDGSLATQRMIGPERPSRSLASRFIPGPAGAIGLAALAAAAAILIISPPVGVVQRDAVEADRALPQKASAADQQLAGEGEDGACQQPAVSPLLKSELLRRAASIRGADRERIEQVAGSAVLRVHSARERSSGEGAASCSAIIAIDLPPGVVVDGGRSNLSAELAYGISESADGALRLASLSGAGRLIRSLATLAPAEEEEIKVDPIVPIQMAEAQPRKQVRPAKEPAESPPSKSRLSATTTAEAPPTQTASSCRLGNGWAERTICSSSNLSALDRQLGLLYGQSLNRADDGKRAVLLASRDRFQERRNACRSESCLTGAYVARLREISDIMAKRSQR